MDDRRLKDIVQHGTSEDVAAHLSAIRETFIRVAEWVRKNKPRDERNLVLFNLLTAVVPYVALAEQHRHGPAQVLALCARSLYELRLRLRQMLRSPEALDRWLRELATDRIDLLEGYLELSPDAPQEQRALLVAEASRIRSTLKTHGLEPQRPPRLDQIVKEVGDEREHRSLFKLYSKLLHPSSYLVNMAHDEIQGASVRAILIVHVQLYALSVLEEARIDLGVPKEMVAYPTTRSQLN
jgi:hypothetical protein